MNIKLLAVAILMSWAGGFFAGQGMAGISLHGKIEDNSIDGYHCAPIVKVSTMEEAKKQIEINQVMTGVKG